MQFETFQHQDRLSTEIRCRYMGLDGQQRTKSQEIHVLDDPRVVEYAKHNLERSVREDLADQAVARERLMSRQREDRNMADAFYPPVGLTTATAGSVLYATGTASASADITWTTTTTDATDSLRYATATNGFLNVASPDYVVEIEVPVGKRSVTVRKTVVNGTKVVITEADITKAMQELIEDKRVQVITHRAERRAEDLLHSMISEIDFRSYKENGFFMVKAGNKLYRIYRDKNKWIDMWEADQKKEVFIPKNRLCTHTRTRDLPNADEALAKLLLIRSGSVIDHSNLHSADGGGIGHYIGESMNRIKDKELILV